ncbi:MAG: response regulator transcription factor [Gaiellaceae bacterium]
MAGPTRVLLVDDDRFFAESVAVRLGQDERLEVVGIAEDGAAAIALAEELAPDLVLMDIAMPGLDGVAATREIRERSPDTQVVMLTASTGRSDEEVSGEAGAIGFLRKTKLDSPRVADSLLALIELS